MELAVETWYAHTTGERPSAPPQPIRTTAKVKVEITKLFGVSYNFI